MGLDQEPVVFVGPVGHFQFVVEGEVLGQSGHQGVISAVTGRFRSLCE